MFVYKQAPNRFTLLALLALLSTWQNAIGQDNIKQPVLDSETRLKWYQQHLEMREQSEFKELKWKHIGPLKMSGRVTDIAKPHDQKSTFYVASASGGVWKTTNNGADWQPIFDDAPSGAVGAITVDPQASDTVWVGLGEANVFRSTMSGTGVYRSDDAGATWTHCGLADTHHIARIVVHPKNSDIVYVAASGHEYTPNSERGIYKSTDRGKSWKKVLFESDMSGGIDLAIDPIDPNILYASLWHRIRLLWSDPVPGDGGGIYKSVDGGETWKRLTNGLPERKLCGRIGIALAASQPETIYAIIDSHEVTRAAQPNELDNYGRKKADIKRGAVIYRSDDRGENWRKASEDGDLLPKLYSTYGWVFGQIRVDPNDAETIYTLGIILLKSTDGGKTYERLSDRGLHADHHAMWINPDDSNYIINGNDGGINISFDGGEIWKDFPNLPIVQFYNVAFDWHQPFRVYGSIQDNHTWSGPHTHDPKVDPHHDWVRAPGGEASYIEIDPNDPNTLYSEGFYGSLNRTDLSTDRTESIKPEPQAGEPPLRGQWLAPFQLSKHDSNVVYHGMNHLFRSMNRGNTWEQISPDLTNFDATKQGGISFATISSLSESPLKFGLLYVGTDDGRVHVTQDSGKTWTEILDGLPKTKWVSRVIASEHDEATVYLTKNGKRDNDFQVYVYRSSDYGKTWNDISLGIPGGPVNVIKEDPKQPSVLYVGTDLGIYVSLDKGKNWQVLGSGLPITFVHDLIVHPRDNIIVIATHGRGMFTMGATAIQEAAKQSR